MSQLREIEITQASIKQLRKDYDKAVADNKEVFQFSGTELYTPYAKYLLEFYEARIKNLKPS